MPRSLYDIRDEVPTAPGSDSTTLLTPPTMVAVSDEEAGKSAATPVGMQLSENDTATSFELTLEDLGGRSDALGG